ncbi:hypothetical protein ACUY4R_002033 [Kosakonia sp. BK9b]
MKLSLTVEAGTINVLVVSSWISMALNWTTSLTWSATTDIHFVLLILPESWLLKIYFRPPPTLPVSIAVQRISTKPTTPCCTNCHTSMKTLVNQNGFIFRAQAICSAREPSHFRYCVLSVSVSQKPVAG